MAWNMNEGSSNQVTVNLGIDGGLKGYNFAPEMTLGDAVKKIASENGLANVIVTENGSTIEQEQATKQLKDLGEIKIVPKNVAA